MTATQAPATGPLSAQQEEAIAFNLCSLHGFDPAFVATQRDFAFAVIKEYERARLSLAPTAPVEASVSVRGHGPKCWGKTSVSDEMLYCYCGSTDLRPQPSGFLATLTDEQRGEALAYTGDDTHPQLSGETRAELIDYLRQEFGDTYDCTRVWSAWSYGTMGEDDFDPVSNRIDDIADAILALLSARPLALGGQQGEGHADALEPLRRSISDLKTHIQAVQTAKKEGGPGNTITD